MIQFDPLFILCRLRAQCDLKRAINPISDKASHGDSYTNLKVSEIGKK